MKGFLLALTVFAVPVLTAAPASAAPASSSLAVIGPFSVGAAEADALEAEFAAFTNASRVEIIYDEYVGAGDLEDRATGPNPPDLIITPQVGQLESLAPHLVDLAEFVNPVTLRRDFGDYQTDAAPIDGAVLGAPGTCSIGPTC